MQAGQVRLGGRLQANNSMERGRLVIVPVQNIS